MRSLRTQHRVRGGLATVVTLVVGTAGLIGCGGSGVTPTASPTSQPSQPSASATVPPPSPSPTQFPTSVPTSPTTSPTKPPAPGPAATALPSELTGHVVSRIPTTDHVVALTFDGGSGAQAAASVLSTLTATNAPATFFLTGRFTQTFPQTTRAIAVRGIVGNHTMTHPHLPQLSSLAEQVEVTDAESVINAATGRAARPWFRFPFGEYDARSLAVVNDLGYAAIGWTADTLGWEGRARAGTVDDIVARVIAKLQPGMIVLMHLGAAEDGSTLDADSLPKLIAAFRGAGYSLVTVNALR